MPIRQTIGGFIGSPPLNNMTFSWWKGQADPVFLQMYEHNGTLHITYGETGYDPRLIDWAAVEALPALPKHGRLYLLASDVTSPDLPREPEIEVSIEEGPAGGEFTFTIEAVFAGDGVTFNDNGGGAVSVRWRLDQGTWTNAGVVTAGREITVSGLSVRAYDFEAEPFNAYRAGEIVAYEVTPKEYPVTPIYPTAKTGAFAKLTLTAGVSYSDKWSNRINNAVSYRIVSGPTGLTETGTAKDDWTYPNPVVGTPTIQVEATSSTGHTATFTLPLDVVAAPVAASWLSTFPADGLWVLKNNTALDVTLSQYAAGSPTLVYAVSPALPSAFTFNTTTGRLQLTGSKTTPIAEANYTFSVDNDAGPAATITRKIGILAAAPVALTADDIAVVSYYTYGGTTWRKAHLDFPNHTESAWTGMRWTRTQPVDGVVPDSDIETVVTLQTSGDASGRWGLFMTDAAKNGINTPRTDWSLWGSADPSFRFWFSYQTAGGWSDWSPEISVPAVDEPVSDGAMPWLMLGQSRQKDQFDANKPGSTGQQFERACIRNQGLMDPAKVGWIMMGQDENAWRLSKNNGQDWNALHAFGQFQKNVCGGIMDTDEDILILVADSDGHQAKAPDKNGNGWRAPRQGGLFQGRCDFKILRRPDLRRSGGSGYQDVRAPGNKFFAGTSLVNGATSRRPLQCVVRRPQKYNASMQPQLAASKRPIIWIEQMKVDVGDTKETKNLCGKLWAWSGIVTGPGQVTWTDMGALPDSIAGIPATPDDDDGIFNLYVAKNGDILICSKVGAFVWEADADGMPTGNPKKVFPSTGSARITSGGFDNDTGSDTSASGAYIGREGGGGGIYYSANVRTTGFTKPEASDGVANKGLPASNVNVGHMAVSPVNGKRVITMASVDDGDGRAYLSTNGAKNFSRSTSTQSTGASAGHYDIRGGAKGGGFFSYSYAKEMDCFAGTYQTASRSIDGGASFDGNLCQFFYGDHTKGWAFKYGDTAADVDLTGWIQQDYACRVGTGVKYITNSKTTNGTAAVGVNSNQKTIGAIIQAAGGGTESYSSGKGTIIHSRSRVINFMNRATASQRNLPVICDLGSDGKANSVLVRDDLGFTRCNNYEPSPKVATTHFIGRWTVKNAGAADKMDVDFIDNFSGGSAREIISALMNPDEPDELITYWSNQTSGDGNADASAFYRGTGDDGGNKSNFYTIPGGNKCQGEAVTADRFHANRLFYVRDDNKDVVRMVTRDGSTVTDTARVNLRTMAKGVLEFFEALGLPNDEVPTAGIEQLIGSFKRPGRFYAIYGEHGFPNWWMTDDYWVTAKNISFNCPSTQWNGNIHPTTDEVVGHSSMGSTILETQLPHSTAVLPNRLYNQAKALYTAHGTFPPRFN